MASEKWIVEFSNGQVLPLEKGADGKPRLLVQDCPQELEAFTEADRVQIAENNSTNIQSLAALDQSTEFAYPTDSEHSGCSSRHTETSPAESMR